MSRYNRKSSLLHKIVCFRGIEIDLYKIATRFRMAIEDAVYAGKLKKI